MKPTPVRAETVAGPGAAERARTIVEYGGAARLRIAWAAGIGAVPYIPDESGEPWLLLPEERTAGWPGRDFAGVLHVEEDGDTALVGGRLAKVPADQQAGQALTLAALRPVGALLDVGHGVSLHHLAVEEIRLTGSATAPVDLAEYVAARPDPVRPHAARVLGHLALSHRPQLAAILHAHLGLPAVEVTPVGLDRFGLEFSYRARPGGDLRRERVPFQAPIRTFSALGAALRAITPCGCRATLEY